MSPFISAAYCYWAACWRSGSGNIALTEMKSLILTGSALVLCLYGSWQLRNYAWTPAEAPRWNPLALRESGFGRTLARAFTEQANTSYHHGLFERKAPVSTNPLSQWLDTGAAALGFQ